MERLVLVHGSVGKGDAAWAAQHELAGHFELAVLNRPGFPPNPPEERIDFEEHARWVGERLRPGDHLCGHSYGAVVSLFAAGHAEGLRSLTVIEPPAFGLAEEDPQVSAFAEGLKTYWAAGPSDPRDFLRGFYAHVARRQRSICLIRCRPNWNRAHERSWSNAAPGRPSRLSQR